MIKFDCIKTLYRQKLTYKILMQDREKLCYVDALTGAQGESYEKNLFVGSIIVNGI